ncbi:MAG TPA: nitrate/nitrite transporter NrtS [Ktedonosporobacter sp.]|jgi:hypothetical protein|nr:nitrate/nitrite transporter NrtS [Ktedonosporobacter sp.]
MKKFSIPPRMDVRELMGYCAEYDTLQRALKTALVVGTILGMINHGQALLTGHMTFDRLISMLVTYLVPFSVSMYSQIQGKRQRDRLKAEYRG